MMTRDWELGDRVFRGEKGWSFVQRTGKKGSAADAPDAVVIVAFARARGKPTKVVPRAAATSAWVP